MRVRLVPMEEGKPIEVVKDLSLVGRREDCDVLLEQKSVSKLHCVIVKTDGLLLLRDLGSTNGTRVNGQRIRRAALLPNDQLHVASLRFKVQFSSEEDLAQPSDLTQQMDAKEVARLLKQARPAEDDSDSDIDVPGPPIQANQLPDVYPDNPPAK
jgi:pSer/pThr/pTyr-binding forkhead associated (FHA) protein